MARRTTSSLPPTMATTPLVASLSVFVTPQSMKSTPEAAAARASSCTTGTATVLSSTMINPGWAPSSSPASPTTAVRACSASTTATNTTSAWRPTSAARRDGPGYAFQEIGGLGADVVHDGLTTASGEADRHSPADRSQSDHPRPQRRARPRRLAVIHVPPLGHPISFCGWSKRHPDAGSYGTARPAAGDAPRQPRAIMGHGY